METRIRQLLGLLLLCPWQPATSQVVTRDNLDAVMSQYGPRHRPLITQGSWEPAALKITLTAAAAAVPEHRRSGMSMHTGRGDRNGHNQTSEGQQNDTDVKSDTSGLYGPHGSTTTYRPHWDTHKAIDCNNDDLPACNISSHVIYYDYPYMFEMPDQSLVKRIVSVFELAAVQSACALDPFLGVQIDPQATVPISVELELHCQDLDTRVAFRPSVNLSDTAAFAFLKPINCSVYWNDLSIFGQNINFLVWMTDGWRDEFGDRRPEYFYDCVHQESKDTGNVSNIHPPIQGLHNLVSFVLHDGTKPATPSPVFTRYLWPNLAEAVFSGYLSSAEDVASLQYTMPNLQSLELIGEGRVMNGTMTFPWTNESFHLPMNLSRTLDGNDQYVQSIGLDHLERNIFRRILVLDNYKLQDLSFLEINGSLDKIQVIRCSLSTLEIQLFKQVLDIQALDFSGNFLTSLPSGLFDGMTSLTTLRLDNNRLTDLTNTTFRGPHNLKALSLASNHLKRIDDGVFAGLPLLTSLDLSHNLLVYVSDNVLGPLYSDYLQLTKISFKHNNLNDFPTWLLAVRFLSSINLSQNNITFSGIIRTLKRIDSAAYIEINNGYSTSTTGYQYKPVIEKTINMENNRILDFEMSSLDVRTFLYVRLLLNFFQLDLNGNTLICDCHMYGLAKYLRSMDTGTARDYSKIGVLPYNLDYITCQLPATVFGKAVVSVNVNTFGCYENVPNCPPLCQCWVRSIDSAVKVNCSFVGNLSSLPDAIPRESVELDFSRNQLTELQAPLPQYMSTLRVINLNSNRLVWIESEVISELFPNCTLDLRNNVLTHLPRQMTQIPEGMNLSLSGNLFVCDCHTLWLKQWLISMRHHITDIDSVLCASGKPEGKVFIDALDQDFVCLSNPNDMKVIVSVGTLSGLMAFILLLLISMYKYRGEIKILLYMRFGWHFFDKTEDTDTLGKYYDAFVSYSHGDAHWVWQHLRPFLEDREPHFRLCLHDRDFMAGAAVMDNISTAVNISRHTIIMLSRSYLHSQWCHEEFQQAHYQVLRDRSNYLIMIVCEDMSGENLGEEMSLYLRTKTYLTRDSRWFWDKLRYAMPQRPLSALEEETLGHRRDSQCPLIDAVAQGLHESEAVPGATGRWRCSYRGHGEEEPLLQGSETLTCCQSSGPSCCAGTADT